MNKAMLRSEARHGLGRRRPGREAESGAAEAELVMLAPLLLVVAGLILAMARLGLARSRVEDAAGAAVSAAVVAPTASAAQSAASAAARQDLAAGGVTCTTTVVHLDLSSFRPGGEVWARVACTVSLSSAAVPGLPGSVVLAGTGAGPVDPYRNPT